MLSNRIIIAENRPCYKKIIMPEKRHNSFQISPLQGKKVVKKMICVVVDILLQMCFKKQKKKKNHRQNVLQCNPLFPLRAVLEEVRE